jgi:hypothetical protein
MFFKNIFNLFYLLTNAKFNFRNLELIIIVLLLTQIGVGGCPNF